MYKKNDKCYLIIGFDPFVNIIIDHFFGINSPDIYIENAMPSIGGCVPTVAHLAVSTA